MNQSPISYGVRQGNESCTIVPEDCQIRPLRDQIVLEPLDWQPSSILHIAGTHTKPLRGLVRAVGPGCYPIRYLDKDGDLLPDWKRSARRSMRFSRHFKPTTVKVGDIVELGGLELGSGTRSDPHGYLHKTIIWGTKQMVVCREEDVAFIVASRPLTPETSLNPIP